MGQNQSFGLHEIPKSTNRLQGLEISEIEEIKVQHEMTSVNPLALSHEQMKKILKFPEKQKDEAVALFNFFDKKSLGKISMNDFISCLLLLANASFEEKAKAIFKMHDFDQLSSLQWIQIVLLVRSVINALQNLNGLENRMTKEEIESVVIEIFVSRTDYGIPKKKLRRAVSLEQERDWSISLADFLQALKNDIRVLRTLDNYDILSRDDFGVNFGLPSNRFVINDPFLEEEIQREKLGRDALHEDIKLGNEISLFTDEAGNVRVPEIDSISPDFSWMKETNEAQLQKYDNLIALRESPSQSLTLEHVYGYRSWDVRNNVKFYGENEIVYFTSAIGIVLNTETLEQRHFCEHTDDITCLSTLGSLVATGQVGHKPKLCLWDPSKGMNSCATIFGTLQVGITAIAFSSDRKRIAAIGMDEEHCLAVYDLQKVFVPLKGMQTNDALIGSTRVTRDSVFDLVFDLTNKAVVVAAFREIIFIKTKSTGFEFSQRFKSGLDEASPSQNGALLCLGPLGNVLFAGDFSGDLVLFTAENNPHRTKAAHSGPITGIVCREQSKTMISAGQDGKIMMWDISLSGSVKLKPTGSIDISKWDGIHSTMISSFCVEFKGKNHRFLIGTRGSEIIEYSDLDRKAEFHVQGHCFGSLQGLAVNPFNSDEFVTAGEDGWIYLWSIENCYAKIMKDLQRQKARCISYYSKGKNLAVGMESGAILFLKSINLENFGKIKDSDSPVNVISISDNTQLIGVGHEDGSLAIYNEITEELLVLRKSKAPIRFIDFTKSGEIYRAQDAKGGIFIGSSKERMSPSIMSEEKWATSTVTCSFETQGIWSSCLCQMGIDSVNSVDVLKIGKKKSILALGDKFSRVQLFRYPVFRTLEQAYDSGRTIEHLGASTIYTGHAESVTNVKFTNDPKNPRLLTAGGRDNTIIQWKINGSSVAKGGFFAAPERKEPKDKKAQMSFGKPGNNEAGKQETRETKKEELKKGKKNEAEYPFLSEVKNSWPIGFKKPKLVNEMPDANLKLKHVFSLQTEYSNLVKYCADNRVVFVTGSLGVLMETGQEKTQSFYSECDGEIVSLSIHPTGTIIAMGESQISSENLKTVRIRIWDLETKVTLSALKGFFVGKIQPLRFSPDGTKLLGFGNDQNHSLGLYDWSLGQLLGTAKVDKAEVSDACWKNETQFLSCGPEHVKLWQYTKNGIFSQRINYMRASPTLCCIFAFPQQICITGNQEGKIYYGWGDKEASNIDAHPGGVQVFHATKNMVYSGGSDGKVITWLWNNGRLKRNDLIVDLLGASLPTLCHEIISFDLNNTSMLINTRGARIYEITSQKTPQILMNGHFSGEINGLAVSPSIKNLIATCGDDKSIKIWNISSHALERVYDKFDYELTAIDWSFDGVHIIVGSTNKTIYLFNRLLEPYYQTNLNPSSSFQEKTSSFISEIKIAPNNLIVAVGYTGDASKIDILDIVKKEKHQFHRRAQLSVLLSVRHMDWDKESKTLVINTDDGNIKFVDIATMKILKAISTRQMDWSFSWTCCWGLPVQGIYQDDDIFSISAVCRSFSQSYLVSGDIHSKVNLYRCPSLVPKSQCKSYKGHSGKIKSLRFMLDDNSLVSISGKDRSLILWETDFNRIDLLDSNEFENEIEEENYKDLDYITKKDFVEISRMIGKKEELLKGANEILPDIHKGASEKLYNGLAAPSNCRKAPLNSDKAPFGSLKLDHVHGYRAKDCKSNVRFNQVQNVVYHAAGVGIVHNPEKNKQKFFTDHEGEITAIAFHPKKVLVATGDSGDFPKIHIWDSNSLLKQCTMFERVTVGVGLLSFSPSGDRLLAGCIDENHSVLVFDAKIGYLIASSRGAHARILSLAFKSENQFYSGGINHMQLWTISSGNLQSVSCYFERPSSSFSFKVEKASPFLSPESKGESISSLEPIIVCSLAINKSEALSGCLDGSLLIWDSNVQNKEKSIQKLHQGSIDSIFVSLNL